MRQYKKDVKIKTNNLITKYMHEEAKERTQGEDSRKILYKQVQWQGLQYEGRTMPKFLLCRRLAGGAEGRR